MNLGALRRRPVLVLLVEARLPGKWHATFATFSSEGALGYGGEKAEVEKLWRDLFSKPSEWRDHRLNKANPSFPDFKHKEDTQKALWLDSKLIPPWVEGKLVARGLWALQSTPSSEGALRSGGKKAEAEKLWRELFSNPSEWRDHRSNKNNPSFPDFKHEHTHKALWLDSPWIPPWVEPKLAALPPDIIQVSAFSWNQKLTRCSQAGQYEKIIEIFLQMQREGKNPDRFTYCPVLKACANLGLIDLGRRVHKMMPPGYETDLFIGTTLVDMYAKCGKTEEAETVFKQMPTKNVVTMNAMLSGYVKCGEGQRALDLFEQMQRQGVDPDPVTFVGVLNACASVAALDVGRQAHEEILRRGYESDVVVGSCLVDMYAKCGRIEEAERVFKRMPRRDIVTMGAMIGGFVKCGEGQKALELYEQMQYQGMDPDRVTFVGVLNACASVGALEVGRGAHEEILRRGYESDIIVGSSLVDMYAKCGNVEDAERVFNRMPTRNVVTFSAMIDGYVKCGEGQKALELYEQMQAQGVGSDAVTFVGVLNACASIAALEIGRRAHREIIRRGYESDVVVGSCLIDMYAKCGSIQEAERVFNKMPTKNVVSWTALLAGYGIHGYGRKALETFKDMCKVVEVDGVTFATLLSACSHGGLVTEGLELFKSMSAVYHITPTVEHFSCAVDLLGRAGRLEEAEDLIMSMPIDPNATVWMALLGACRAHVNVEVGERCAKRLQELDVGNAAAYVLLSNIYIAAGRLDSSARVNRERLCRGLKKIPGRTWIEVNNQVHSFTVDDDVHPEIVQIRAELEILYCKMKNSGYVPDKCDTAGLQCVNDKEKEVHLCYHSEKLAIAFGLMRTAPGTPLQIVKNLRVCSDCHAATKFIARMVGRAITVRDANRFHHFQDGCCSCQDYW